MNTIAIAIISVITFCAAMVTSESTVHSSGFRMWFERAAAVLLLFVSASCIGLVIWRLAA